MPSWMSTPNGYTLQLGMRYTTSVATPDRARQRAAQTKRNRTRAAILDAARRLFVESGWLPTTVDGIATEAGVGTATVYNHFPSKNVIAGHAFRPLIEDLLVDPRWADDTVRPSLALTALIDDLTSRVRSQTALTIALLEAVNDSTARHGTRMDEEDPRYWVPLPPLFTQIIRRGQDCGEFLDYPPAEEAGPLLSNLLLLRVFTRPAESAPETSRLIATIAARLLGFEEPDSPTTHATRS
jgi:AcrR family transcriptional regulator